MNTYTVTYADAHAHSVQFAGIAANSKLQAVNIVAEMSLSESAAFSALQTGDTWTVTVTQP